MYESLLLESGKVFIGRRVSGIGGNVVDDSRTITIPVFIPEGLAEIVSVVAPPTFTPGVPFQIDVVIRNNSNSADILFVRFTNVDTGEVLATSSTSVGAGETAPPVSLITILVQTTDFHCLIEVGHGE